MPLTLIFFCDSRPKKWCGGGAPQPKSSRWVPGGGGGRGPIEPYIYVCVCVCVCVYPPIYTPLPNSRWLHHTALRYVRRAQLGGYLWRKGLNSIKMGSKWAKNTYLSIPNGPGSLLEKRVFDPFLTHCWSQNGPFSRHFAIFHGPKRAPTGSKRAKNTCLSIRSGLGTTLEKMIFFAPGTLVDPPLAPAVRGAGLPSGCTK